MADARTPPLPTRRPWCTVAGACFFFLPDTLYVVMTSGRLPTFVGITNSAVTWRTLDEKIVIANGKPDGPVVAYAVRPLCPPVWRSRQLKLPVIAIIGTIHMPPGQLKPQPHDVYGPVHYLSDKTQMPVGNDEPNRKRWDLAEQVQACRRRRILADEIVHCAPFRKMSPPAGVAHIPDDVKGFF